MRRSGSRPRETTPSAESTEQPVQQSGTQQSGTQQSGIQKSGTKTNVLFICSQNELRSPTAEAVFANYPGIATKSAGTAIDAQKPVTEEMIHWADLIFAMENLHYKLLKQQFRELIEAKEVIILRIRDEYSYMDPELIEILKQKVTPYLSTASGA